ncbi:LysR substrate-binding domain-containing protein [Pseudooceanicola sp. C21-150M6]|uniref:LysR substrate-binding domain-containing protein n=1 Tax=Pseudooceanicola sp. C21-150M6 TaxID=3434355 RepID=UPI003D7FF502
MPPLRGLEAFEAVARLGSVQRASEELSLTPSAVSHRLRSLEERLNARLFHRTNRRIFLTDAGKDYIGTIGSAFDRIERSTDRLAGDMASDVLTVHCPPSFAPSWLLPRLPGFMSRHPDIDLRIHASPEPVDFFRSDTDVEIRYGNSDWAGLVVTPIIEDRLAPMAAPNYVADRLERPLEDRLAGAALIVSERAPILWDDWFRQRKLPVVAHRGLRFDRGYLALQAARDGLGIALESTTFAERDLNLGRLVRIFPEEFGDTVLGSHTMVHPPVYSDIPKVQAFKAWIVEEAKGRNSAGV